MIDILDLEGCRGCRLYHGLYAEYKCLTREYTHEKFTECPCRICLVKVTCHNACEIFIEFKDGYRQKYMDSVFNECKDLL